MQETKLPIYWNTSFSKVCLGMKIPGEVIASFILINKNADPLYSLIVAGNSAPHHWAATRGKRYLVQKIICSPIATEKALTHTAVVPRQESVFLVTTKTTAAPVILSLGLEPKIQQTVARVEIGTSKSWDVY